MPSNEPLVALLAFSILSNVATTVFSSIIISQIIVYCLSDKQILTIYGVARFFVP
ncbi:hypothetical protein [Robertmurraya sp. P23]|uniref:hypothetical protein n=1 Tax=Robertmurraya sp. P23 TaxID=3436931 RepID=UPI003D98D495